MKDDVRTPRTRAGRKRTISTDFEVIGVSSAPSEARKHLGPKVGPKEGSLIQIIIPADSDDEAEKEKRFFCLYSYFITRTNILVGE